jgi:hypothetical protein
MKDFDLRKRAQEAPIMDPTISGIGTNTADQTVAAKPPTPHSTVNSATVQADNRATAQETANFSPPTNQGYQPGGPNNSDGR